MSRQVLQGFRWAPKVVQEPIAIDNIEQFVVAQPTEDRLIQVDLPHAQILLRSEALAKRFEVSRPSIARHYTTVPIKKKGSVISDTGTHFEHVLARNIQAERRQMLLSPLIVPQIVGSVESGHR